MTQLGFIINLDSCMDHRGCMTGCKKYKNTPMGIYNVECATNTTGTFPEANGYFIPLLCQQCSNPSCVPSCTLKNLVKNGQGIITVVDKALCASCSQKACISACPYGAISADKRTGLVYKCDMCEELLAKGSRPACVGGCLTHSWVFGDFDDPDSEVSQLLSQIDESLLHQLKPETGNAPNVFYFLSHKPWNDMNSLCMQCWHER